MRGSGWSPWDRPQGGALVVCSHSSLSPLPQFGNSGGPLVNLVSAAVCPLVLCPSVGMLVGGWEASRRERRDKPGMRALCSV